MSKSPGKLTRRRFLEHSASFAAGSVAAAQLTPLLKATAAAPAAGFLSNWHLCPDRVWIGPEYWANPLQDWQLANGRIEALSRSA